MAAEIDSDTSSMATKDLLSLSFMVVWMAALAYTGFLKSIQSFFKVCIALHLFFGFMWAFSPINVMKKFELTETFDGAHMWLAGRIAIMLFYCAATMFVCLGTDDNTVSSSLLWTQITTSMLFAMNVIHLIWFKGISEDGWTKSGVFALFAVGVHAFWIAGCVAQLRRLDNFGGYMENRNRLTAHVHLDSILTLVAGIMYLAFPDFIARAAVTLPKIDESHLHLCRIEGSMYFSSAILAVMSAKFLFDETKGRLLLCRFVVNVTAILFTMVILRSYNIQNTTAALYALPYGITFFMNPLIGFLRSRDQLK